MLINVTGTPMNPANIVYITPYRSVENPELVSTVHFVGGAVMHTEVDSVELQHEINRAVAEIESGIGWTIHHLGEESELAISLSKLANLFETYCKNEHGSMA